MEIGGSPHWHPTIQVCLYQNAAGMWLKYGAKIGKSFFVWAGSGQAGKPQEQTATGSLQLPLIPVRPSCDVPLDQNFRRGGPNFFSDLLAIRAGSEIPRSG
jgi:hypothetical protein